MKYRAEIIGWGEDALDFLIDEDINSLVIFNEDAPPELAEIAVLHKAAELLAEPAAGDSISICGKVFKITAVGDEAIHTLKTLGHCTLNFKGGAVPERPGCIMLEGAKIVPEDLQKGGFIEIF